MKRQPFGKYRSRKSRKRALIKKRNFITSSAHQELVVMQPLPTFLNKALKIFERRDR